jgi:hypothetical protein
MKAKGYIKGKEQVGGLGWMRTGSGGDATKEKALTARAMAGERLGLEIIDFDDKSNRSDTYEDERSIPRTKLKRGLTVDG